MPLDGRLEKMERAAGRGDGPCAECGQSGEAFGGRDREEVLREAAERAAKEAHVVRARARADAHLPELKEARDYLAHTAGR